MTTTKYQAPIGYSLTPNNSELAVIDATISKVAEGNMTLREAAAYLTNQLGRSVSHEWIRNKTTAFKSIQEGKQI